MDGGPAFPVSNYVNASGETFESNVQGMTLRDYFAANAPAMPDDWPAIALACDVPRPKAVDVAASNERLRRAIADYRRDPCFDLEECGETDAERAELRAFSTAQDAYHDAVREWQQRNRFARLTSWRWAYADAMLRARKGGAA
jgi:hypothetical protein